MTWSLRFYDAPFGTETGRTECARELTARGRLDELIREAQNQNRAIAIELWNDDHDKYTAHFSLRPAEVERKD